MNPIEVAINRHIDEQSPESLDHLYTAFLSGKLFIATDGTWKPDPTGAATIRALCVKKKNGQSCLPAFTSLEHLREWQPEDPPFAEIPGFTLFHMASTMAVEWIVVNHKGIPQGQFSRKEILLLAEGKKPKN